MTVALRKPMTQAEFFDWAEARDERYEFDGLQPVAMVGAAGNHARIVGNTLFQLHRQFGADGPCEALADAGIQTVRDAVRYPDVLVTCSPFDGRDRLIPRPVIVFEVVSPSSTRGDRILKPQEYGAVASIERYVLVEQSVIGLTVLWRTGLEPWNLLTLQAGDTLRLPEVGAELPVDALYRRVTFGSPGDSPGQS